MHPDRARGALTFDRSTSPDEGTRVFDISPVHLILFAAIALIVVGPRRLPEMARNLGRGVREFKSAIALDDDGRAPQGPAQAPSQTPTATATVAEAPTIAPAHPAPDISSMVRPGDDQPERPNAE